MTESQGNGTASEQGSVDEALAEQLSSARGMPSLSASDTEALFQRLDAQVSSREKGLGVLRSLSTPVRQALVASLVAAFAAAVLMGSPRPDLEAYPLGRMVGVLGVLALFLLPTLAVALRPVHRPAPASWMVQALLWGGVVTTALVHALPAAHTGHPASALPAAASLAAHAGACLGSGVVMALPVYVLLRLLDRGLWSYRLLIAATAGLSANLLLQLKCPMTASSHLLAGHLGVSLVLIALDALLVRRAAKA